MNAVTCLTWVRKGVLSCCPEKANLNENKLKNFIRSRQSGKNTKSDSEDDEFQLKRKRKQDIKEDNTETTSQNDEDAKIRKQYGLSDDEDDEDEDEFAADTDDSYGMSNLAFYTDNKQDPYLKKGTTKSDNDDEDDDDETLNISPDDNAILAGKADDDFFSLELWIYNEKLGNDSLYCHHDYILPACPLVVDRVGGDVIGGRKLGAVGDLDGNVSLWDLEMMDCLDPTLVLSGCKDIVGGDDSCKKKKKKIKKTSANQEEQQGHKDAVLSLSWNELQSNLLASSSADATIGLWDLGGPARQNCVFLGGKHPDKIQSIQWHPIEAQMLLAGCADSNVQVFDCRRYDESVKRWKLSREVEKVLWNACSPFNFFVGSSDGMIHYLDIRMDTFLFQLEAHKPSSVTDLTKVFLHGKPFEDCLLSSSEDGFVKIWSHTKDNKYINKKNFKIGAVFCMAASSDTDKPIFAVGGEKEMKVVDLSRDLQCCEAFHWSMSEKLKKKKKLNTLSSPDNEEGTSNLSKKVPKKKKLKQLKASKKLSDLGGDEVDDMKDNLANADDFDEDLAEKVNLKKKEIKLKHEKRKKIKP